MCLFLLDFGTFGPDKATGLEKVGIDKISYSTMVTLFSELGLVLKLGASRADRLQFSIFASGNLSAYLMCADSLLEACISEPLPSSMGRNILKIECIFFKM